MRTFFRYYQSKTDAIYVDVPSALKFPAAADRLIKAMSSKTFVARRSALRQEWRQDLANLIEPHLDAEEDRELKSLTLATNTLNVREIAREYWFSNGGGVPVVDCFNKALTINHAANQLEIPRSLSI